MSGLDGSRWRPRRLALVDGAAGPRHAAPGGPLRAEHDELQRRVDDLRAFEADYRARLIAFHEEALRKLRGGLA